MLFVFHYMLIFFGLFMSGIVGLMPLQEQFAIPGWLRFGMFGVGFVLAIVGITMVHGRAIKTGAIHLLEWGKPGKLIWFYVHKDGTIKITPAMRAVEGHLYSRELDAQIMDLKSYRLFDHSVRFVPEGTGHSVDLGMCLYVAYLKNKWGLTNIREARQKGFMGLLKKGPKPEVSQEHADVEGYYGQS